MTFSGCRAATRLLERWVLPSYYKIYNSFSPFNHSMLKYNLFRTCLCNWFGQNKSASIYSTFINFPSQVAHGEILI